MEVEAKNAQEHRSPCPI